MEEDLTFKNKFVYVNNKKYGTCKEIVAHHIYSLYLRASIFKPYYVHLTRTDGKKDMVPASRIRTAGSQGDILYIT